MSEPRRVAVFADGSCFGSNRPGGFAAIIMQGETCTIVRGQHLRTSRNRECLHAFIAALERIARDLPVAVTSENEFLLNAMHSRWHERWRARGWTAVSGAEIRDADLWRRLAELAEGRDILWQWTPEHDVFLEQQAQDIAWDEERSAEASGHEEGGSGLPPKSDIEASVSWSGSEAPSETETHSRLRQMMQRNR